MSNNDGALAQLETAAKLAPAGFALAGHFTKLRPSFMLQCYPKDWTAFYARNSLAMVDPAIAWGLANEGTFRWSDFDATSDPSGVASMAAGHGLTYGIISSIVSDGTRSMASFARADKEFEQSEIEVITAKLAAIHAATLAAKDLAAEEIGTLASMGIAYTRM